MNDRVSVDPAAAFVRGLGGRWPDPDVEFGILFSEMDAAVREEFGTSTSTDQALRKSHGDWYEYLLAAAALRAKIHDKSTWLALQLPNRSAYSAENLYKSTYSDLIFDLKQKVENAADVVLESSNPDFVIVRSDLDAIDIPTIGESVGFSDIVGFRNLYRQFNQRLEFDEIAGYVGTKFTLRPDRRLQLAHEGSLVKALYVHLQTRLWALTPAGIRYYAAASHVSNADLRSLKTVATHSIVTVTTEPQRAVDRMWIIRTMREAQNMFSEIYALSSMAPRDRAAALRGNAIVGDP